MHAFKQTLGLILLLLASSVSRADGLSIVTTITPIQAIVSSIVGERGDVSVLINGSASPHHFALKPSQVRRIQTADLLILVDFGLETFIRRPARMVAKDRVIQLSRSPQLRWLETREIGVIEASHEQSHGHNHSHSAHEDDLHLWLDPNNAIAMARYVVSVLSAIDPQGQSIYEANLQVFLDEVTATTDQIEARLGRSSDTPYVVFHDAFQYFEKRFRLMTPAVVTLNPEMAPSAKVVREIRELLLNSNTRCVFREPQFSPAILEVLTEGLPVTITELDPLGDGMSYTQMLNRMTQGFESCFNQ